jgi:hypothetical protein
MPNLGISAGMPVPAFDQLAFTGGPGCRMGYTLDTNNLIGTKMRLYNGSGGACVAGRVYVIRYDGDEETNPKVVTCAASPATTPEHVAVAMDATASGAWGWFAVAGYASAFVNGDTVDVSKDDYLKVDVSDDDDAFVGNTSTRTANSFAIATAAETDATPSLATVYLLGDEALIAA